MIDDQTVEAEENSLSITFGQGHYRLCRQALEDARAHRGSMSRILAAFACGGSEAWTEIVRAFHLAATDLGIPIESIKELTVDREGQISVVCDE